MNTKDNKNIPAEKFRLVQHGSEIHDLKFDTKPIGYFKDAWIRFKKNKGSVVAAIIIGLLVLMAILVPIFSTFEVAYQDTYYAHVLPKNTFFAKFGFWDGVKSYRLNQQGYDILRGIPGAIVKVNGEVIVKEGKKDVKYYDLSVDTYKKVGYVYLGLTKEEYEDIVKYEKENNIEILSPVVNLKKVKNPGFVRNANYWYEHDMKGRAILDEEGNLQDIYQKDENGKDVYYNTKMNGNQYQVRVLYYNYYTYKNGHEPIFMFGCDNIGHDILVRLASGARTSLLLAVIVSLINITIGVIYGAIEGYYGGYVDLLMERFTEILNGVPFIIVVSLFQINFAREVGPLVSLIFAFVFSGWVGPAYRIRTQFYRFKGQEYVLAARTLGAKDMRLIFKHILPNSLGTFITSAVLIIPSVIFGEAILSYLGIVNLQIGNLTSVGTMLNNARASLSSYPHELFFPSGFISLLMISFNLFGNGLRDAFNPSLRGAEE